MWFDSITMICISVNVADRLREVIMRSGIWSAVSNPLTGGKGDGMKRKGKFFILFLLALLALTACGGLGKEPKSGSGENEPGEEQAVYIIQETAVPNPDLALADLREADGRIWEQDYQLKGGKLYRLVQLEVKTEDSGEAQTQVYMQVLDPARGAWENYRIPVSHWDETEEYEVYLPQEIIAVEEDRVYLKVLYWDETYRLGVWSEDGSGGLLCVLPEELKDMKLVIGDGKAVGAYKRNQDSILLLDGGAEELQVKDRVKVPGQVMDVLCNPQSGELYWYGYDEERRTGVWRVEGNDPAARSHEGKGNASLAACSEEGVLYLANSQDLWRCSKKEEPEFLCHFFDLDYYIEVVHGMSIQEDAVFLLAGYEGKDHILQVTKAEGAVPEKQKIVLAVPRPLAGHLKQAVAQFNRRNREYRVEAIEPEEGESGSDFLDRIQREMLAGGAGPDLFYGLTDKAEDFVENGYLQEVWDFLPEEGVLWQAALEDGSIYALFQTDGEVKLCGYEYDPDAVSQVTRELKLYTVYENAFLKQAAVMYHKAHPEVRITIENEYPMYHYGETDYDAVYQKLNTMLMGEDAPDILMMDHLNADSYGDKGLLEDLEDVVGPMEESGEVLSNITGAYVREDGKRYVVPLQFGFTMAVGRDIAPENMESLEALAKFLSGADDSYMGKQTAAELAFQKADSARL